MQVIARVVCLFILFFLLLLVCFLGIPVRLAAAKRNGIFSLDCPFVCSRCSKPQYIHRQAGSHIQSKRRALSIISFTCITVANQLLFAWESTDRHDGSSSSKSKYFSNSFRLWLHNSISTVVVCASSNRPNHFRAVNKPTPSSRQNEILVLFLYFFLCKLIVIDHLRFV
jgi:hypothetical protein